MSKKYHVQVVMEMTRQIEVEIDDDQPHPGLEAVGQALAQAKKEYPGFDAYKIEDFEQVG